MNVIYDESKAIQKKKEADDALPKENREARIHNAIWIIPTIVLGVLITTLWVWASVESGRVDWDMNYMSFVIVVLMAPAVYAFFAWLVLSDQCEPTLKPGENYPALVLYYQTTAGKNVLDHKLISCQDDTWNKKAYKLKVVLEDQDHSVSNYTLPVYFSIRTQTNVPETTVDLEKSVVYVPYNPKDRES